MSIHTQSIVDFIWKISPVLSVHRPIWHVFMQIVHQGAHPQSSLVMFLAIIDLDPTCIYIQLSTINLHIYSTLNYVCKHARKHQCTHVITFDQLVWWKTHIIVENHPDSSELHSVVVRLGNFHAEISPWWQWAPDERLRDRQYVAGDICKQHPRPYNVK